MSYDTIALECSDDGLAVIALNRPDRLNAWNQQLMLDLYDAVRQVTAPDSGTRVVLVHGRGRAFGAGGDMELFAGERRPEDSARRMEALQGIYTGILSARQVFVAAVHGYCVGSALVLAGSCDLRLSSLDAKFLLPEVNMGMLPGIGIGHAAHAFNDRMLRYLLLTGKPYTAAQAERDGFVSLVEEGRGVLEAAHELCIDLLNKPADALAAAKRIVFLAHTQGPRASIDFELAANAELLSGNAVRERARAFLKGKS